MTHHRNLCGFYGLLDDESLGMSGFDWLAIVATAGGAAPFVIAKDYFGPKPAPETYTFSKTDFTKSPEYLAAQARLARAQTAQRAAEGRLAGPRSSAIPINIPSFSLPGTSPLFPVASAPATEDYLVSTPQDTVQGDAPMSNATAHVEAVTKAHGLHASIAPSGAACCPSCGTPLHVVLTTGPTCSPGDPAGDVHVVGEYVPKKSRALKAQTPGTCVCACPGCGVPICLSLTDEGYSPRDESTVSGYHIMGYSVFGKATPTKRPSPHKASIVKAGNAVTRASKAGATATSRAKQYDPSKHKPIVPLTAIKGFGEDPEAVYVHGNDEVVDGNVITVFGVVFGADKPLTPIQKAAVQKHANAVILHAAAAKAAAQAGAVATQKAKELDAHRKKYAPAIAKFLNQSSPSAGQLRTGPKGNIRVLGDDITVFGLNETVVRPSWLGLNETIVHPSWLGLNETTRLRPPWLGLNETTRLRPPWLGLNETIVHPSWLGLDDEITVYGAERVHEVPNTIDVFGLDEGGGPTYDPSTDPDLVPMPVRGQPLTKDEAAVTWRKVPEDGVKYDGSKGMPSDCFGSYNIMYGPIWQNERQGDGFVWHANPGEEAKWWAVRRGHGDAQHAGDDIAGSSAQFGWGPLVGNPNTDMRGLQWAVDDKQWFWQSDKAPAWATAEADAVIALTNKKTSEANAAAAAADAKRIAQEQAQMAEDQAKQDAANALALSAANTQEEIAQKAHAAQQAQADLEQQRAEQQQAAAEAQAALAQQMADQRLQAQAAQIDLQAAQAQAEADARGRKLQLDYIQQHPEVLAQPQPSYQEDGDDSSPVSDPGDSSDFENFADGM